MTIRTKILTTAILVCHLLVFPRLVTSQLPDSTLAHPVEEATIEAARQEKAGDMWKLSGNVKITFRGFVLLADTVTYNNATGDIDADGHLVFDGGPHDEHIEATHATYNIKTDSGKFYNVVGTTGARFQGTHVLLTSSSPFSFAGSLVEKAGPDKFIVHNGRVTSCSIVDPKWEFSAGKVEVVVGENARLYHSTFRLHRIPIFYFPYARLPVERLGRQTGFLIPTIGQSSRKGTIIGDSIYWAINRWSDATLGAEYFSHRGWSQHGQFRSKPSDNSFLDATYFGVLDRGIGTPHMDQGGEEVTINGEAKFPAGFRGVANLDYLSSYVFRQAFADSFTQAVNSEVKSVAFLSKAYNGFYFNTMASRYQNFQSTQRGDLITILHAPSIDLNSVDRSIAGSPIHWGYDIALQGVSRREPDFVTDNLVGRFDIEPRISVPLHLKGWDFAPQVALLDTYYTQRRVPNSGVGLPGNGPINRRAFETAVEVRPPGISKVFDKTVGGYTIKHTIEPRMVYRYVNGVDNFNSIVRFDARDILSDTNEIEYGLINRIFAKGRQQENCDIEQQPDEDPYGEPMPVNSRKLDAVPPKSTNTCVRGAREIVSWELAQKYFMNQDFGGALTPGVRNVFTTTEELTGIAFLTEPRLFSPIVSRLKIHTSNKTDVEWHLDYDTKKGRISDSTALVNHRFGDFFVAGSHAYLRAPGEVFVSQPTVGPTEFNQFRWLVGYGNPNKRGISSAANIGFDISTRYLQYGALQTSYNWDCCGVSFEYRRLALGSVRNENQYRFALSLTNIGTFGTLRRQERLF